MTIKFIYIRSLLLENIVEKFKVLYTYQIAFHHTFGFLFIWLLDERKDLIIKKNK